MQIQSQIHKSVFISNFSFIARLGTPIFFLKCIKTRSSLNIFSKLILCNELCVDSETHYSALIRPNVSERENDTNSEQIQRN